MRSTPCLLCIISTFKWEKLNTSRIEKRIAERMARIVAVHNCIYTYSDSSQLTSFLLGNQLIPTNTDPFAHVLQGFAFGAHSLPGLRFLFGRLLGLRFFQFALDRFHPLFIRLPDRTLGVNSCLGIAFLTAYRAYIMLVVGDQRLRFFH